MVLDLSRYPFSCCQLFNRDDGAAVASCCACCGLALPDGKGGRRTANAWNIVDIWESYPINPKDLIRETDLNYCGVLQEAHERYRQHFQEQEVLRKDA